MESILRRLLITSYYFLLLVASPVRVQTLDSHTATQTPAVSRCPPMSTTRLSLPTHPNHDPQLKPDASFELSADKTNYAIFGTPAYGESQGEGRVRAG